MSADASEGEWMCRVFLPPHTDEHSPSISQSVVMHIQQTNTRPSFGDIMMGHIDHRATRSEAKCLLGTAPIAVRFVAECVTDLFFIQSPHVNQCLMTIHLEDRENPVDHASIERLMSCIRNAWEKAKKSL